ncbi:hypothetical protein BJY01DRAFT_235534 [Aspergillus pseudoustus]|uniref:FAD/NAD(P)-binding domain-containing protein n=1 Tax=Aspergillus pseudoustus TaxID=1810923 RepID=A0ABR4JUL5_9EURO
MQLPTIPASADQRPANWVPILEQPSRAPRKLRLVCIGAGFAGLILAHRIKYDWKMDDIIDLQIYEKNADIDVYVFPFEPNPNWSSFYAGSHEIWQYMKATAVKWKLEQFVQLDTRVTDTTWSEDAGKWLVKVERDGKTISDECDVLVNASGFLNKWTWPNIEGLHDFQGKLLHTANWDESYDWDGKRVAVIGNGSSAIQLVPEMQRTAKSLVNYIRNPTWIGAQFLQEYSEDGKLVYSEEKKRQFREDPESFFQMRKKIEHGFNTLFTSMVNGTPEQKLMDESYKQIMHNTLKNDAELIERMVPKFNVGCRRLTPGTGYLEALQAHNSRVMWSPIVRVTEKGILTEQGEEEFDLIVTATGFDVSFRPSWNLVGRKGRSLQTEWSEEPKSYFGVCAADHPNYFIYCGPGAPVAHGVLMGSMDAMTAYILRWCRKIAEENIKAMAVKPHVVDALFVWSQELLKRTVWAGDCRSWYKNGKHQGTIPALHAGSVIHYRECLDEIRGEDFDIDYRSANEFQYLGNGFTHRDTNEGDLSFYMTQ